MRGNTLKHRVSVQRRSTDDTTLGQPAEEWVTYLTNVAAQVQPISSRELMAAGQQQAVADMRVTLRYRNSIQPDDRVLWQGHPMLIVGHPIDVEGAGQWLELLCQKGLRDAR